MNFHFGSLQVRIRLLAKSEFPAQTTNKSRLEVFDNLPFFDSRVFRRKMRESLLSVRWLL